MKERKINREVLLQFEQHLMQQELARGTVEKYCRDVAALANWANGREITRELVVGWKEILVNRGYAPATVNSMLAAANTFLKHMGWHDCVVRFLRIQKKLFRPRERELTQVEFRRLVDTALRDGRERQALLMEAIAATGVRVSEVQYITVEAARCGRTDISLKGKIRTILFPQKLCRKLLKYAAKNKIASGEIFITRSGRSLSRKQIWAEMKDLCNLAGVEATKVFPHNLRHLFATVFYRASRDIAKLADVLGHSSVETTRIYLVTTGTEHIRQLDRLGLVI